MRRALTVAFIASWTVFYAGFFFHRSGHPVWLGYSGAYLALLAVLALGYLVPYAAGRVARALGPSRARRVALAGGATLLAGWLLSATAYYWSREHRFDPVLQNPPIPGAPQLLERSPGTFRILALGGSTTQCVELSAAERYPEQLRALLQARHPGVTIEVVNAGRAWYTSQHSLIQYVTHCRRWQPDLVVVMHAINDLVRSFDPPAYSTGEYDGRYAHFFGPAIRGVRPPTFERWLLETLGLHRAWYGTLRIQPEELPLSSYRSLPAFERTLAALARYVRADGARLVLVTQPSLYRGVDTPALERRLWLSRQLCIEHENFWRQRYPTPGSLARAMDAYNDAARRVARVHGTLLAEAAARVPADQAHFIDDVHLWAPGARLVAESVAATIERAQLVARR